MRFKNLMQHILDHLEDPKPPFDLCLQTNWCHMVFLKEKKEMALIYKLHIHPQMKAKCCHDLLYKRSFHSSSQRANWGKLNHHTAHGNSEPAALPQGRLWRQLFMPGPPASTPIRTWNVLQGRRRFRGSHQQQAPCRPCVAGLSTEHFHVTEAERQPHL